VAVRDAVVSASGRPDEAYHWILEVEAPGATSAGLSDSGTFVTLDAKIAAAITKLSEGDLGRQLTNAKEKGMKEGRLVKGRQLLFPHLCALQSLRCGRRRV
jgi:hypothetical protein